MPRISFISIKSSSAGPQSGAISNVLFEEYEKARSKYPDNVDGLAQAGRIALFLGRDAQAKEYFEKLAELTAGSHKARYANIRLGYLRSKAGEKDEAGKRLSVSLKFRLDSGP